MSETNENRDTAQSEVSHVRVVIHVPSLVPLLSCVVFVFVLAEFYHAVCVVFYAVL